MVDGNLASGIFYVGFKDGGIVSNKWSSYAI